MIVFWDLKTSPNIIHILISNWLVEINGSLFLGPVVSWSRVCILVSLVLV